MIVIDYVMLTVAAALWAAILWHRRNAAAVGALWWSCVCLAVIVSLKIGPIAHPVNRLTGGVYLDELLIHLTGVVMFALTLSWAVRVHTGTSTQFRKTRHTATAVMLVFLVATWFLSPVYDIPASATWLTTDVLADPVMAVHWLVLHLYLVVCGAAFGYISWQEARSLSPGSVRVSLWLLFVAAALTVLNNAAESVSQVLVLTGTPEPDWLMAIVNDLLIVVFLCFLLAVAIPLARRGRSRTTSEQERAHLESLWTWIQAVGRPDPGARGIIRKQAADWDREDLVVEILDGIRSLQRYVGPADLAEAGRETRRSRGLMLGTRARAYTMAVCLTLAARRRAGLTEPVPPPPANLTRYGRGTNVDQEIHWLAAVGNAIEALTRPDDRVSPAS